MVHNLLKSLRRPLVAALLAGISVVPANAESLARLCVAAGGEFPSAIAAIGNWLKPIQWPHYVIHRLRESSLSGRFPDTALSFLNAILNDESSGVATELRQCLDAIAQAMPTLRQERKFMRFDEFARRFGV